MAGLLTEPFGVTARLRECERPAVGSYGGVRRPAPNS
jgi:hypothetical protein